MRLVFLGSTGDHAGQSLVAWALARDLRARGLRPGFLKPLFLKEEPSEGIARDEDCELFKEVLGLQEPLETICPVFRAESQSGRLSVEAVLQALGPVLEGRSAHVDLLLIMGRKEIFLDDPAWPISDVALVQGLRADFVLVTRHLDLPRTLYTVLSICSLLGPRVRGVILNRVPPQEMQAVSEEILARISGRAMPLILLVPEDPILSCRTLAEVVEATRGELLLGHHRAGELVSDWSMGAGHALVGDMAVFRRLYNRIVLLGPPESGSKELGRPVGVILTAGRRPPPVLYQVAQRRDLPLVVSPGDTFTTLELLERSPSRLSPQQEPKAERMTQWLARGGKLDELWASLGLISEPGR